MELASWEKAMKKNLRKKKDGVRVFSWKCRPCTQWQCALAPGVMISVTEKLLSLPPPLRKAIQFMQENYSNDQLRIKDVAGEIGLSVRRLQQFFRDNLQSHFRECLRCLRAGHVKRLRQENPRLTIPQIMKQVGFISNHAFYHAKKEQEQKFPLQDITDSL